MTSIDTKELWQLKFPMAIAPARYNGDGGLNRGALSKDFGSTTTTTAVQFSIKKTIGYSHMTL